MLVNLTEAQLNILTKFISKEQSHPTCGISPCELNLIIEDEKLSHKKAFLGIYSYVSCNCPLTEVIVCLASDAEDFKRNVLNKQSAWNVDSVFNHVDVSFKEVRELNEADFIVVEEN